LGEGEAYRGLAIWHQCLRHASRRSML